LSWNWDAAKFGRWVYRLRLAEGLSQDSVARNSGGLIKHGSSIAAFERGTTKAPQIDMLIGLANGLDIQTTYLLTKAGFLDGDEKRPRVGNFSRFERDSLARALGAYLARHPFADENSTLADLLDELHAHAAAEAAAQQRDYRATHR
jgi:transcriptional regulator with XRE-family HTH domain